MSLDKTMVKGPQHKPGEFVIGHFDNAVNASKWIDDAIAKGYTVHSFQAVADSRHVGSSVWIMMKRVHRINPENI